MKNKKEGLKEIEREELFSSGFDDLGWYTGVNGADGYEPEQDADDL